jgi:hypothetical protein
LHRRTHGNFKKKDYRLLNAALNKTVRRNHINGLEGRDGSRSGSDSEHTQSDINNESDTKGLDELVIQGKRKAENKVSELDEEVKKEFLTLKSTIVISPTDPSQKIFDLHKALISTDNGTY